MAYIMDLREVVGSRPLIMAAAGVLLIDAHERVLLQRRTDNHLWGIPGGAMELGESFEETARREVREETGLSVGMMSLFYLNSGQDSFFQYPNGDNTYLAAAVFVSKDYTGNVVLQVDETEDLAWFERATLPLEINPCDRPPLRKWLLCRDNDLFANRQGLYGSV